MAKLGFLGLGLMGGPMAKNLLKAGHDVAVWSHTSEKARKLAARYKNARYCASPKAVGRFGRLHLLVCRRLGDVRVRAHGQERRYRGHQGWNSRSRREHHRAHRRAPHRESLAEEKSTLPRRALHRLDARRHRRHAHLHDRWQQEGLPKRTRVLRTHGQDTVLLRPPGDGPFTPSCRRT